MLGEGIVQPAGCCSTFERVGEREESRCSRRSLLSAAAAAAAQQQYRYSRGRLETVHTSKFGSKMVTEDFYREPLCRVPGHCSIRFVDYNWV